MEAKNSCDTGEKCASARAIANIPLVSDLDGTLITTDCLYEGLLHTLRSQPLLLLSIPFLLRRGRQYLKIALMDVKDHVVRYPLNPPVLQLLQEAAAKGREIWLATASPCNVAQAMAHRLGFFKGVLCSTEEINLKGDEKARSLSERFGYKEFDYIGDDEADMPVWASARKAYVYGSKRLFERVLASNPKAIHIPRSHSCIPALRELRIWQWVKNVLVFLPLFLSHDFSLRAFSVALLAFIAFSLCASAVYVFNDMADLANDRSHPVKCKRPLASGAISLKQGAFLACGCLGGSIASGAFLGLSALVLLGCYFFVTLCYSYFIKKVFILDALVLAGLYNIRVILGCLCIGVSPSHWLLSFLLLFFFGLALIKRAGDLEMEGRSMAGRSYVARDLPTLMTMVTASGFSAIVIFCLYINSHNAQSLYSHPDWLWLMAPVLLCWYCRLIIKAGRGEVKGDPLLFSIKDSSTWITGLMLSVLFIFAL